MLVIQDISAQGGKAYIWLGTNLQYPSSVQEIDFKVIPGAAPVIDFDATFGNSTQTVRLIYAPDKNLLMRSDTAHRPLELSRTQTFYVYKDYSQYLASKRISAQAFQNKDLSKYGQGYMLYLPEGYKGNPDPNLAFDLFSARSRGSRG